jgi:hypothetical protein
MTLRFIRTSGRSERGLPTQSAMHLTTGIERVEQTQHAGWKIEITHRQVGMLAPRSQYTASIRALGMQQPVLLSGFASHAAALQAGKEWINLRSNASRNAVPAPKRLRRS